MKSNFYKMNDVREFRKGNYLNEDNHQLPTYSEVTCNAFKRNERSN